MNNEQIKNIEKAFSKYVPNQKIMTHIISDIKDYEKYCVSDCSDDPNCVECLKTVFENIYSIFDRYNKEGGTE